MSPALTSQHISCVASSPYQHLAAHTGHQRNSSCINKRMSERICERMNAQTYLPNVWFPNRSAQCHQSTSAIIPSSPPLPKPSGWPPNHVQTSKVSQDLRDLAHAYPSDIHLFPILKTPCFLTQSSKFSFIQKLQLTLQTSVACSPPPGSLP